MKTLTKEHRTRHTDVVGTLQQKRTALEQALDAFNKAREDEWAKVERAVEELNTALDEARVLRDEVVCDLDMYAEGRSEKWAESDAGSEHDSWKSAWEDIDLEDVEIDEPEDIEMPDVDVDAFESAPMSRGDL